jgi:excisionase family DNA binding protein
MQQLIEKLDELIMLLHMDKTILNADELCLLLGISKTYLYRLTSTGKIKFYRPFGKLMYFDKEEVLKMIKQTPIETQSNILSKANDYLLTSKKK